MTARKMLMLLRHGTTGPATGKLFIGRTDLPLDADGRAQIRNVVPFIRERNPECCLCSPLTRARQTAEIVESELGLDVRTDADLREIDFGRWEGLSFEEIAATDPEKVDQWAARDMDFAFPGGEPVHHFLARVKQSTERLVAESASTVLAITHGGVIRAMICHLLGLPESRNLLFGVKPGSLTTIEVCEGHGVLTGLNIGVGGERQWDE